MNKKKSFLIIGIIVLAAAVAAFLGIYFLNRPHTEAGGKQYSLTVVHSDNSVKNLELRTDEEYLGAALINEKLISGTEGPYGLMIEVVDGESAVWEQDHAYWALYIGSEYATTGVDTTPVTDGGKYTLEYTKA